MSMPTNAPLVTPTNRALFQGHEALQNAYEHLRAAELRCVPGIKRGRIKEALRAIDTALGHLYLCPVNDEPMCTCNTSEGNTHSRDCPKYPFPKEVPIDSPQFAESEQAKANEASWPKCRIPKK